MIDMKALEEKDFMDVVGGVDLINQKLSKLKKEYEAACKHKNINKMMSILPELQARGEYAWAKETANHYGIYSI